MKTGKDVMIYPLAKIIGEESSTIGDSVIIDDFVLLSAGRRCVLGSFVHIAAFTSIVGGGEFIMEDFCGLSGGIRVYTGNEDYSGGGLTNPAVPPPYRKPIRSFVCLQKHAIVGANSVILPGVTIGTGAVVGATSLVKSDCDPWTIYVGSPARPIGKRPSEKIQEMERKLRDELYDREGRYIPKAERDR